MYTATKTLNTRAHNVYGIFLGLVRNNECVMIDLGRRDWKQGNYGECYNINVTEHKCSGYRAYFGV